MKLIPEERKLALSQTGRGDGYDSHTYRDCHVRAII